MKHIVDNPKFALIIVLSIGFILRIIPVINNIGVNNFDAATHLCYLRQNNDLLAHLMQHGNITPEIIRQLADQKGYLHAPTSIGALPWLDRPLHQLSAMLFRLVFGISDLTLLFPAVLYSLLTMMMIYLITTHFRNQWLGVLATSLVAISGFRQLETLQAMNHLETNLLLLMGIYFHLLWTKSQKSKHELLAALLWGFAIGSHPDVIPFIFFFLVLELIRTFINNRHRVFRQIALLSIMIVPIILIYDVLLWICAMFWGKAATLSLFVSDKMLIYQNTDLGNRLFEGLYLYISFSASAIVSQVFTISERLISFLCGEMLLLEGVFMMGMFLLVWIVNLLSPVILYLTAKKFNTAVILASSVVLNMLFLILYHGVTTEIRHFSYTYLLMVIIFAISSYDILSKFKKGYLKRFIIKPATFYLFLSVLLISNVCYVYPLFFYRYGTKSIISTLKQNGINNVNTFTHSGLNVYLPAYGIRVTHLPQSLSRDGMIDLDDSPWLLQTRWANPTEKKWITLIDNTADKTGIKEFYCFSGPHEYLINNRFFGSGFSAPLWRSLLKLSGKKVKSTAVFQDRWIIIYNQKLTNLLNRDRT